MVLIERTVQIDGWPDNHFLGCRHALPGAEFPGQVEPEHRPARTVIDGDPDLFMLHLAFMVILTIKFIEHNINNQRVAVLLRIPQSFNE
jgi:hypothetical protein